ncbi:MAG: serine hydrolase [Chitinophagaceae bacterium]|nr:serine hydrolase [Chitinophagaceae bacterium]
MDGQVKTDAKLVEILNQNGDSLMQSVLKNPAAYRYQIIYTRIDRDRRNKPSFTNFYYNVDSKRYFNPASVVKMPLAFLSLEKLNQLRSKGVDKFTGMEFDSSWSRQSKLKLDSTSENTKPSIAHFIKKAFLISDNDAYTRMYEFVGQQSINSRMHGMGYNDTRITRRFVRMNEEENRHTNQVRFVKSDGSVIYTQPPQYNTDSFDFSQINRMGKGYINAQDSLINEPIDFTKANSYPLEDMQQTLQSVMFPKSVAAKQRFELTKDDYAYLYRYLSQYPSETDYPKYDTTAFYDSYVKFFFRQGNRLMPKDVRVFNKVGWAYGCLTDVSYVVDFKNRIEFMLAVTIYVNNDGILNDDKYEYDSIGWPFLYKVGQTIYQHELKRERNFKPDLKNFQLKYTPRSNDGRKAVKDVDN